MRCASTRNTQRKHWHAQRGLAWAARPRENKHLRNLDFHCLCGPFAGISVSSFHEFVVSYKDTPVPAPHSYRTHENPARQSLKLAKPAATERAFVSLPL